jgi:hypothetical protein
MSYSFVAPLIPSEVLAVKQLSLLFARHRTKLWPAAGLVVALLVLNMAPARQLVPGQWEYRTVVFKVEQGDPVAQLQAQFDGILNREATAGWEFVGPCAHLTSGLYGIDYVVLRRRVQ